MKSIKIILLAVLSCVWVGHLSAQQEIVITLNVDTGEITAPTIDQFCNFGQEEGISNEEYTIEAEVGDTIVWRGISTSSDQDQVLIVSINHQGDRGGRDIFGENRLEGTDGVVRGTILNGTEEGTDYKYMLSFRVLNNGEARGGLFNIDPKIKVVYR
jgi:hypothetical protein